MCLSAASTAAKPGSRLQVAAQHQCHNMWLQSLQLQATASQCQQHICCCYLPAVLVFCMGNAFLPGSPAFATLVIWICSVVGAQIAHFVSRVSLPAHASTCMVAKHLLHIRVCSCVCQQDGGSTASMYHNHSSISDNPQLDLRLTRHLIPLSLPCMLFSCASPE